MQCEKKHVRVKTNSMHLPLTAAAVLCVIHHNLITFLRVSSNKHAVRGCRLNLIEIASCVSVVDVRNQTCTNVQRRTV